MIARCALAAMMIIAGPSAGFADAWECTFKAAHFCEADDSTLCGYAKREIKNRLEFDPETGEAVVKVAGASQEWITVAEKQVVGRREGDGIVFTVYSPAGGARNLLVLPDGRALYASISMFAGETSQVVRKGQCEAVE